jgi:hypothetical protein
MSHVQELVTMFETIHHELEIESVWFIKKSRRGGGFQRWHQDLVGGIGTTVATIVVNIDSVDKEDEEFEVENIHCLNKEVIEVFQQVGSDVKVRDAFVQMRQRRVLIRTKANNRSLAKWHM